MAKTSGMRKRAMQGELNKRTARRATRDHFVLPIYRDMGAAITRELDRLRATEGVEPSCAKGCSHCCRQPIPLTRPEAQVVAQYVSQQFSPAELSALRARTMAWFAWTRQELPQLLSRGIDESAATHEHGPPCPLLDSGACSIYAARPAICRTHFVSSNPGSCAPRNHPEALPERLVVIESIHAKTTPHVQRIRKHIEAGGHDFWDSVGTLPQLLAAELGWTGDEE